MARSEPVYSAAGRVVGHITGDGWLEKRGLDPKRHMLHTPTGWATDAVHLEIPGLRGIRLVTVTGEVWEAPLALWRRYGIPLDRGHGLQVVLPARWWQVRRPGEPEAVQLALFGEGQP
jgi:hypothetical protein